MVPHSHLTALASEKPLGVPGPFSSRHGFDGIHQGIGGFANLGCGRRIRIDGHHRLFIGDRNRYAVAVRYLPMSGNAALLGTACITALIFMEIRTSFFALFFLIALRFFIWQSKTESGSGS